MLASDALEDDALGFHLATRANPPAAAALPDKIFGAEFKDPLRLQEQASARLNVSAYASRGVAVVTHFGTRGYGPAP